MAGSTKAPSTDTTTTGQAGGGPCSATDGRSLSMSPPFELTFFAHAVHRHGGQERAAWEVLSRVANRGIPVTVVAGECDLGDRVRFIRVPRVGRPLMLTALPFQWRARRIERGLRHTLTNSIGAAARDADVITAQFCHASYTAQYGGQRGSGLHGRAWQRVAQEVFTALERRAYGASRLRRVIAVSLGTARDIVENYDVDVAKVTVVPNGVDLVRFCLLYTSDAADDLLCVDLGGSRII